MTKQLVKLLEECEDLLRDRSLYLKFWGSPQYHEFLGKLEAITSAPDEPPVWPSSVTTVEQAREWAKKEGLSLKVLSGQFPAEPSGDRYVDEWEHIPAPVGGGTSTVTGYDPSTRRAVIAEPSAECPADHAAMRALCDHFCSQCGVSL